MLDAGIYPPPALGLERRESGAAPLRVWRPEHQAQAVLEMLGTQNRACFSFTVEHPDGGVYRVPPLPNPASWLAVSSHFSSQARVTQVWVHHAASQCLDEACLIFHPDYLTSASLLTNSHY